MLIHVILPLEEVISQLLIYQVFQRDDLKLDQPSNDDDDEF
jgi:hypothetical protein